MAFIDTVNNLYSSVDFKTLGQNIFKKTVNLGDAVMSAIDSTGIAGFVFHVPESEEVNFRSNISSLFVEDNSPIADHVALEPIVITLRGFQGDYFYSVNKVQSIIGEVRPVLNAIGDFIPKIGGVVEGIKTRKAEYEQIYETSTINERLDDYAAYGVDSGLANIYEVYGTNEYKSKLSSLGSAIFNKDTALDLFHLFQDLYKITSEQTRAYLYLEALWKAKQPFSVETSWKRYDNMVIQSLRPFRDNNADITDFTVTLQQVNFVSSKTELIDKEGENQATGRTADQKSQTEDLGKNTGTSEPLPEATQNERVTIPVPNTINPFESEGI